LGITRIWPGLIGAISINARIKSSSYILVAAISPATILQKIQSTIIVTPNQLVASKGYRFKLHSCIDVMEARV
jgi:hypothetical protein